MHGDDSHECRVCALCGSLTRVRARFCSGCGTSTDGDITAAPPPPSPEPCIAAVATKQSKEDFVTLTHTAWFYGALMGLSLLVGWLEKAAELPWPTMVYEVAMGAAVVAVAVKLKKKIVPLLHPRRMTGATLGITFVVSIVCLAVLVLYFQGIEALGVSILPVDGTGPDGGERWHAEYLYYSRVLHPSLFEELAFRGIIQTQLERLLGTRHALLVQAALFSVLHLLPMMFVSHFVMGLAFGYLRRRTASLYPGMILHASWNSLVIVGIA